MTRKELHIPCCHPWFGVFFNYIIQNYKAKIMSKLALRSRSQFVKLRSWVGWFFTLGNGAICSLGRVTNFLPSAFWGVIWSYCQVPSAHCGDDWSKVATERTIRYVLLGELTMIYVFLRSEQLPLGFPKIRFIPSIWYGFYIYTTQKLTFWSKKKGGLGRCFSFLTE